jgi:hypothetical protein
MKSKYGASISFIDISSVFAQKTKLKLLKSVKKRKPQEAATILQGAESLLSNADDDESPVFFVKETPT